MKAFFDREPEAELHRKGFHFGQIFIEVDSNIRFRLFPGSRCTMLTGS